jgi:hypothetical protein
MRTLRSKFTLEPRKGRRTTSPKTVTLIGPSRAARTLALAHHIERMVEAGELANYSEAARALGLTRARLTQVMNLLLLAPEVQERLLLSEVRWAAHRLRVVVGEVCWGRQVEMLTACGGDLTKVGAS